jgi:predicted ATP-grasp superfamily ATP-dependent carboligase
VSLLVQSVRATIDSNPTKAERDWPTVVVAGAYQTGVVLMRDLARRGVSVCCIDCHREAAGFRTIYGPGYECPNPDEHPSEWLNFMIGLAEKLGGKPVLMASADQFVSAIAMHADALEERYIFHKSSVAVQSVLATKEQQYELASRHGMPVSRTRFVKSLSDAAEFGSGARFPCLIKPVHARVWEAAPARHPLYCATVLLVDSADELIAKYRLAAEINPHMVIQEVIEGPDTAKVVYLSCYGGDGRRIGSGVVRELRTCPAHFGAASVVEPVVDEETDTLCDQFLQSIGYAGFCEIELKRDARDGKLKMIEANPRYSVTADAATYGGVVLGWLHYLDLIGQPVVPVQFDGREFRHICLMRDFRTIDTYLREGLLTWRSVLSPYRGNVGFYDFDLRDWRVTAKTVRSLAKVVAARIYRRFVPKKRREKQVAQ